MAVSTGTATALIQSQVQSLLVQPLEAQSKFLAAGPRIFDTAGPIRIPKLGPATTQAFVAENAQIPEQDVSFSEIGLMPSTMQSVKVITRFSNEMVRQSSIALDAALKTRLVKDVADRLDTQFLSASGDGTATPKGLFAFSGVQNLGTVGALTLDVLHDAWGLALTGNVDTGSLKWLFRSREFVKLRKLKDNQNRYQLQPDPTQAGGYTLLGIPVVITDRVPDTTGGTPTARAALVDFSQIAVARDMDPSVTVLSERYADYDQQAIRVVARYDLAPMNPAAVVTLTGITI